MIITTVLRSGGEYKPEHVHKIWRMCQKHLPDYHFMCLSDTEAVECPMIPLTHNWPGWWSKMELFSLPGPILYFDLDTIITGDCSEWLEAIEHEQFAILRDVYRGKNNPHAMQSSVMYWSGDMRYLYEQFKARPDFSNPGGDQAYLEENLLENPCYLQDMTDSIISYKADYKTNPKKFWDASVIFFHGKPRPWGQNDIDY